MKLKLFSSLFMIALAVSAAAVTASAQGKKVFWDFRKDDTSTVQKFPAAEENAVLKYLLGDSWDSELGISSRVSGSFTKAGAKQTLYYIDGCEEDNVFKAISNCPHVIWHNAGRIAIYEGTKPVAKISEGLGYEIAKITDLNGDGIHELFSLNGWGGQGITITNAGFGQIENGKYRSLKGFEGYVDNCGNDRGPMSRVATVISYGASVAGKMPVFTMEYFKSGCKGAKWTKITKWQFDRFTKDNA